MPWTAPDHQTLATWATPARHGTVLRAHLCERLHQMERPVRGRAAQSLCLKEEKHAVERERAHLNVHIQCLDVPGADSLCKPTQQ